VQSNVDLCPHNIGATYRRVLHETTRLGLEDQEAVELYLEAFERAELGEIGMFWGMSINGTEKLCKPRAPAVFGKG